MRRSARRRNTGRKRSILLLMLSLTVYMSVITYFGMQLSMVRAQEEPFCTYLTRASNVCGMLVLTCVYVSLWYRLNVIFYIDFQAKFDRRKRAVILLNKAALFFLFVATAVNAYTFITSPGYATIRAGCVKVQEMDEARKKWYGLVSTTVIFQMTLLFLYVYPLHLHRMQTAVASGRRRSTDFVIPKIRRACAMAVICVLSDIGSVIIALLDTELLHWTRHAVYGTNLTINAVSLMFSFEDWHRFFLPGSCKTSCCCCGGSRLSRVSTARTVTCDYPAVAAAQSRAATLNPR